MNHFHAPPTNAVDVTIVVSSLRDFAARFDDEDGTLQLVHEACGEVLCDLEHGDPLDALVAVTITHRCPGGRVPTPKENP